MNDKKCSGSPQAHSMYRCVNATNGEIVLQKIRSSKTEDKTQIAYNSGLIWFIPRTIRCQSHVTHRTCFVLAVTPLLGLIIHDEFVSISSLTSCNLSQCRLVEKVLLCGERPPSLSVIMLPEWKQVSHFTFSRPFFPTYLFICFNSAHGPLKLSCSSHRWPLLCGWQLLGMPRRGKSLAALRTDAHTVRRRSSAQKVAAASCSKAGFPLLREMQNWGEIMTPCKVWNAQDISWDWCIIILSLAFH